MRGSRWNGTQRSSPVRNRLSRILDILVQFKDGFVIYKTTSTRITWISLRTGRRVFTSTPGGKQTVRNRIRENLVQSSVTQNITMTSGVTYIWSRRHSPEDTACSYFQGWIVPFWHVYYLMPWCCTTEVAIKAAKKTFWQGAAEKIIVAKKLAERNVSISRWQQTHWDLFFSHSLIKPFSKRFY